MVEIVKGDSILNKITNTEHTVESVEMIDNFTVIFTDEDKCKCFPFSDVIKIPELKLSYYFLKKINNIVLSENEELYIEKKFKELKLVSIEPFDSNFFEDELPNLVSGTPRQTRSPFFTRLCKWVGFTSLCLI
jgi:hypothetical protein